MSAESAIYDLENVVPAAIAFQFTQRPEYQNRSQPFRLGQILPLHGEGDER